MFRSEKHFLKLRGKGTFFPHNTKKYCYIMSKLLSLYLFANLMNFPVSVTLKSHYPEMFMPIYSWKIVFIATIESCSKLCVRGWHSLVRSLTANQKGPGFNRRPGRGFELWANFFRHTVRGTGDFKAVGSSPLGRSIGGLKRTHTLVDRSRLMPVFVVSRSPD